MSADQLLPRSTPSDQRVHSGCVAALLDRLDEVAVECHSIMVVRHGHVVAEGWWAPFSSDRPHLLYSVTKSFTSIAVGLAVTDGLLALDDRVVDLLPDHVPDGLQPQASQLTVDHLLTMTTGHRTDALPDAWTLNPTDLVKGFLRVPMQDPPGTLHAYNNATSFVLARMVERVTGRSLADLLDERLFGPMGVRKVEWDRVGSGATFGFQGLHLTTEAVAAFGELLLRGGRWRNRQLVSREWVRLATRRHIPTSQFADDSRTADWLEGYGYHFWISRHGYRADGALGQYCLVIPEHDLEVVMTAAANDMQAALDAVWDHLLPGVDDAASAHDDAALARRLQGLSLPLVAGEFAAGYTTGHTAGYTDAHAAAAHADPHADPHADAIIDASVADSALPQGTSVSIRAMADGWRVQFDTGDTQIDVEVGFGHWRECSPLGRPIVSTGAWHGAQFVADLYVITGPHRVRLTVDAGTATATWNIAPLVGPELLRQLRSPLMTRPDVS